MEAVCVAVFQAKQRARYMETLLMSSHNADKDAKKELIDSYFSELFPYQEQQKWNNADKIREILEKEAAKGPMLVQAEPGYKAK